MRDFPFECAKMTPHPPLRPMCQERMHVTLKVVENYFFPDNHNFVDTRSYN